MKKILLISAMLISALLHAETVVVEIQDEPKVNLGVGCAGDGVLSITGFEKYDRKVSVSEIKTGVFEVKSKDLYRNWYMEDSSNDYVTEGVWKILDNLNVSFKPDVDFTKSPAEVKYKIKGDSICGDREKTLILKYFDGNHFNDLNLPAGAILDELEYIQSSRENIEVLKNDINSKNAKGLVFVQAYYNTLTKQYSCYHDSIYAKTLDGNTTDPVEGRIFATRSELRNLEKIADINVSVETDGLTQAQNRLFYSTKTKYNQKPAIWTFKEDGLSVDFIEKFRDTGVVRMYLYGNRDISTIGYMPYDRYGNFGKCNVIVMHPKGMRSQKVYLDEHKKKTVKIDVLDLNESVKKQAHAAVIKESLRFYPSGEKLISIEDEGTWTIDNNHLVTFTPLDSFDYLHHNPSLITLQYDANRNGLVDILNTPTINLYYPIRANFDSKHIDITVNESLKPLENDTGDLNVETLKFISLDTYITKRDGKYIDRNGKEVTISKTPNESNLEVSISNDGKDVYTAEGHWKIAGDTVVFYRNTNFKEKPSRIGYTIKDVHSKESFGLIDLRLGLGTVSFQPFYDVNKNGIKDSNEKSVKNIRINYENVVTDKQFYGDTSSETGKLEQDVDIGKYRFTVDLSDKYSLGRTEVEFNVINNETTNILLPIVKNSAIVEVRICEDVNENKLCDLGDIFLRNTPFFINDKKTFSRVANGIESTIEIKTSNHGEFKQEFENGEYKISYKDKETKINVSNEDLFVNIIVENINQEEPDNQNPDNGNSNNNDKDGLVDSDSSVPSLSVFGLIILTLGMLLIFRRQKI